MPDGIDAGATLVELRAFFTEIRVFISRFRRWGSDVEPEPRFAAIRGDVARISEHFRHINDAAPAALVLRYQHEIDRVTTELFKLVIAAYFALPRDRRGEALSTVIAATALARLPLLPVEHDRAQD